VPSPGWTAHRGRSGSANRCAGRSSTCGRRLDLVRKQACSGVVSASSRRASSLKAARSCTDVRATRWRRFRRGPGIGVYGWGACIARASGRRSQASTDAVVRVRCLRRHQANVGSGKADDRLDLGKACQSLSLTVRNAARTQATVQRADGGPAATALL